MILVVSILWYQIINYTDLLRIFWKNWNFKVLVMISLPLKQGWGDV